ncbi:MAG: DUF2059 domain-containing protein [Brevundimonas sp.]|uniref:DUF2059 domain-containing protein n=1 Tax=Brevundimonas sp. TaxID=1871086 RepID=UPI00391B0A9E
MRIWTVTAAALVLFAAGTGEAHAAQAKPQSPAAVGQPSARQLSLSRRYIELMQSDQLSVMIRSAIEMTAGSEFDAAELPTEDREFMLDLVTELTTDMMPQMFDRMVPVYARTFSEEELLALIAFYDSDLGRSILQKTYASMPEANAAMMEVMPQMFEKMAARMCVRYGCDTAEVLGEMGVGGDTTAPRRK